MDYRSTLNLPRTDFPMRANLPQLEPKIQARWDAMRIYEKVQARTKGRPKFVLHDGPPYANGDIHVGHALNKVLKDIIVRSRSQMGYDAPYVPGFDTHGMPIEHAVITQRGVDRKAVDPVTFRNLCRDWALHYIERQTAQFRRLGVRGDWERPYVTLEPAYEAEQIKVFGEMAKRGYIYRGKKVIYWSPSAETALADAEIEYREKTSPSIYVAFDVVDGKGRLEPGDRIVIWTTTPWTLPANQAVAVHPDYRYGLFPSPHGRLLLARELVPAFQKTTGIALEEEVARFKGAELEGVRLKHPFYDRIVPVVLGEHVTLDAGTGAVHTAPGHGEEDYDVGIRYGLPILSPIDERGVFTEEAPGFAGLFYEEANGVIIERLRESGHLLHHGTIRHQYPHDWRTKQPVIYRAAEQWFASIDGFREAMLRAIEDVRWIPPWGETRIANMIRDRGDWCISRQRLWGVPIPIFYCEDCGRPVITDETIEHVAAIFRREGSNAWYARPAAELLPPGFRCPHCGGTHFRKETDTMDVWFDSGSSHAAVLRTHPELKWPADVYLEGSDQYRGWFNSSLSTSVAVYGRAPYETVIGCGFVLDGEGRKMSKSLGNVVDPNDIMARYGADILRLWVASVDYTADVRISESILQQIAEVYRKIRNTFRFLLGNLYDFDPARDRVPPERWPELDRYIYARLKAVIARVRQAYEAYDFHAVYTEIHQFCVQDLSAFYLDVTKDRMYTRLPDDPARRSGQSLMHEALRSLVVLLSPILPHTTEEVWSYLPGEKAESVQLVDFPEAAPSEADEALLRAFQPLLRVREAVQKALEEARQAKALGNSLEAHVELYPDGETWDALSRYGEGATLAELFIVSKVTLHPPGTPVPEGAVDARGVAVRVLTAPGKKCERCWMVLEDVGAHPNHPTLCARCAETVEALQARQR
ncbi:isoleucine--tRNA ligase [Hydrogenibacillus schlegelii]|uniref:isoleucine--tRNA ligase n=1 Tax=Hydrogenibacillus schlegelii TaxID=1484 RepID=UPI0023568068|nr:isoleucine--tRNA ligase [Hydrogenibacillus schlegelii]